MADWRRRRKKRSRRKPGDLIDAGLMRVLANPQRVRILKLVSARAVSAKEISEELGDAIDSVNYHVGVLRDHGLIELDRQKPRRGTAERFYRAVSRTLLTTDAWIELPAALKKEILACVVQLDDEATMQR